MVTCRVIAIAAGMLVLAVPGASHAQGFFQSLFGAFGAGVHAPPPPVPRILRQLPAQQPAFGAERRAASSGGGAAFCVRTCDGRYFPAPTAGGQSHAEVCNNFCPATETRVYYGSNIERARSQDGERYTALQNAFRFRSELVAGCTCNGKDALGLARIDINEDRTLRKGDIVASGNGLMVATGGRVAGEGVGLSEMPDKVRASFAHVPVVAKD